VFYLVGGMKELDGGRKIVIFQPMELAGFQKVMKDKLCILKQLFYLGRNV
jgi:hypothetical protein